MRQAFIIMQIGNPELDKVYEDVIAPALRECDFDPKRVDKHNEGGLLKSEIVNFIESSDIIVADLTNERPNCYLEIGFAMGLDKFRNLILTAREDHNSSSKNFSSGGPKIHFDLAGYDILFWDPKNHLEFKDKLVQRIRRRISILPSIERPLDVWDNQWFPEHKSSASKGQIESGLNGYMEIWMAVPRSQLNVPQGDLLKAAKDSEIHTFGWPIGIVLSDEKDKPKVRVDGICAEIIAPERPSYDYWAIKKNGGFYLLQTYLEEKVDPGEIFFDTRIVRITETLLYAARLYTGLKLPPDAPIQIKIMHAGLNGRKLGNANPRRPLLTSSQSSESSVTTEITTSIQNIESDLVDLVEKFTKELFIVFDFFELNKGVLEDIVNKFVEGELD
jgi:hypothetical protein